MSAQDINFEDNSPRQKVRRLVVFLLVLSFVAVVCRLMFFGGSQLASDDRLWRLTIHLMVKAAAKTTAVQIYPPYDSAQLRVVQRSLQHSGFRIRNWSEETEQRRSILAFATTGGKQSITSEFLILQSSSASPHHPVKDKLLSTEERERYMRDSDSLQLKNELLNKTLQNISQGQIEPDSLVEIIFNYVKTLAKSKSQNVLHVPTTLAKKRANTLDRSLSMVALCRAASIPARIVAGLIVKEDIDTSPHYWVEVYLNNQWQAYDTQYGYQGSVPNNYLPMRYNSSEITQVLNGETLKLEFDLEREYDHPYLRKNINRSVLSIFDLTHLSLDARLELALLLLLPLGALITAFCRHLIGLHSYGVFTPTLLALALVYADRLTTIVIFFVVCTLAIGGRRVFPAVISRIPRLAIIFTLIAIIMAFSVSVLDYYDLSRTGKVILLPIIILTSLVDRLYRTIEEFSFQVAMHRLAWTILIALICLPVIQFEALGSFIVNYPELHLISLSAFLLISMYKGKQLMSLPMFSILAEPKVPRKKRKSVKTSHIETSE